MKLVENGVVEQPSTPIMKVEQQQTPVLPKSEEKPLIANSPTYTAQTGDVEIPITPVRKAIASNMLRSKQEIPHAWMMMEVDATNLVALREKEKQSFKQKEGYNLTYFAFFVKAVAQALKEYPQLNSTWAGDKIVQKRDIHLNIAVATEDSLFVPVIKSADEKTIKGIAREITELSHKVRSGKLKAEDMQGGTFTVNNTGSFGSVQSMGIINHPQAAILQIEAIVKRPVIIDGMIAVRDMVNLCLSLDHRVLDGYICGKFLARVKEIVESMSSDRTSIY
ncbi:dihydrolipoamide acetyltransferase family protein [Bacillus sp. JJ722]|uniref:dihydrolipoamide acetyltransferase family protein n=1 Tax=Bacillus sp. JJ722 TaxID=3122973 RepID=UPI003F68A7B0